MAAAAIAKMHDPKISVADKLLSQDGANAYSLNAHAPKATIGAHYNNDAVEARFLLVLQGNFGCLDRVLHRFRGILTVPASVVAQMLRMHYFDEIDSTAHRTGKKNGKVERRTVGYFYSLPTLEQHAAVLAAIEMRAAIRAESRADLAQQPDYFQHKRAQSSERQQAKLYAEYLKATVAFDNLKGRA
eukprot:4234944-Pleurochrysis_carterae.AAC.1